MKSPFFEIFTIRPTCKSVSIFFSCQMCSNKQTGNCCYLKICLQQFTGNLIKARDFTVLCFFIACLTSFLLNILVSMSNSGLLTSRQGGSPGPSLFSTPLNCSVYGGMGGGWNRVTLRRGSLAFEGGGDPTLVP